MVLIVGCGNQPAFQLHKLKSGKEIKVLSVMPIHFTNDSPSLMLRYQTNLKIDDKDALRQEVGDIWGDFKAQVDKGNFSGAIISANEKPEGFILTHSKSYNFVFKKGSNGNWEMLSDK